VKRGKQWKEPKIKWWKLENEDLKSKFKLKVVSVLSHREDANDWWIETVKL
jgi:hypothetical protein